MNKHALVWLVFVTLSAAVSVVSPGRAIAMRDISPYCIGMHRHIELLVEVNEKSFKPNSVRVSEGDCVELVVLASGGDTHSVMIEGTDISSEGAPIVDSKGRHIGRAVARNSRTCSTCGRLAEGWFANGERVLLKFEVNSPGTYHLECKRGMRLTIEAISATVELSQ